MKKNTRTLFIGLCVVLMMALFSGVAISQDRVVVIGTVNADFQIVADNDQVFEIGDNEKGEELIGLVDKRLRATGTVEEEDGKKVLTVISYEVIDE